MRTQNDRPNEQRDEASKSSPRGGQKVKLRAPKWLCDAHRGRDDEKVETNEIRTLPTPPDDHNPPGLQDDRPHGRADGAALPVAVRHPNWIATALNLPAAGPSHGSWELWPAPRVPSCANRPSTGHGIFPSYCVSLTPRFANPF